MEKIKLDRFSPVPLHYQLYNHIKQQIEKGILQPGDFLPPESKIASLFDVSVIVVRQALSFLERGGFIIKRRGKGSLIVSPKTTMKFIQTTLGSYEELKKMGAKVSTEVLEREEISSVSSSLLNILALSRNERVIKLSRLRFVNDVPTFLWTSYIPFKFFQPILKEDLTKISLFKALEEKCNLRIIKAKRWIEVVKADASKAKILGLPEFEPLFYVKSIAYIEKEIPVEYYEGWFRTDNLRFYFETQVSQCM